MGAELFVLQLETRLEAEDLDESGGSASEDRGKAMQDVRCMGSPWFNELN